MGCEKGCVHCELLTEKADSSGEEVAAWKKPMRRREWRGLHMYVAVNR